MHRRLSELIFLLLFILFSRGSLIAYVGDIYIYNYTRYILRTLYEYNFEDRSGIFIVERSNTCEQCVYKYMQFSSNTTNVQ